MSKLLFKQHLLPVAAILALVLFFGIGCADKAQPVQPAEPAGNFTFSGHLDTLFVDSANFVKLDSTKRTVFEFRIGGLDSLTLEGWTSPNQTQDPFSKDPNIRLLKGRTDTSQTFGPGIYLGNQVLHKNQIKKIQEMLATNHAPYVLFAPANDKGHVYYTIFLGIDDPRAKILIPYTTAPVNTNQSSNPSPPKSYTN
jgi:hypothetical protein